MTDIPRIKTSGMSNRTERRRRRIARELRALRLMDGQLTRGELLWALVTIPGVALLCGIVAYKLHWFSKSLPLSIIGAILVGALVWWIGRRWFVLAALIVIALVCIAAETLPDNLNFGRRKERRRKKLERAIAKREAILRNLEETKQ
jgi:hypothetical protein